MPATLSARPKADGRGRPRSPESERAIMDATLALLGEVPLRDLTIEAIAQRAGVGKATIYKWWPGGKAYVALTAFLDRMQQLIKTTDTGSARLDFLDQLTSLIRFYGSPHGRIFRQFVAECQADPGFAETFRERFLLPRRAVVAVIWQRGVERGEIDPDLDGDLVLDMIYAPLVFRVLLGHAPFTAAHASRLVESVFAGISANSRAASTSRRSATKKS